MVLFSHRKKQTQEFTDEKWDYINLPDFKAKGCGPGFAYFWLWLMLIVSVIVYGLDSFIAVNLLIFDQWSSKIEPGIPLHISKWIFSVCIILSFINLAYEAIRAFRVMRRGYVAECYLDSLAVRWESIRLGNGQGWRRFLVFAELTKSKKGAEYVALFTYFSLKTWIRVLICSGPRQVINAFTFKSVYQAKLAVNDSNVGNSIAKFFSNIGALADEDYQQALVLGSMAFTFVVWVFSLLFLIAAILFYVTFLCHWVPRSDGGLSGYCERKVNQALKRIVTQKVNKALAKGQANRMKADIKAAKKNGEMLPVERVATLPTLPNVGPGPTPVPGSTKSKEDSLPEMPMLGRAETMATLPAYTSRPTSPRGIEMDTMSQRRPPPARAGTMASTNTKGSYSSKSSLLGSAADMGQGRPVSPVPSVPNVNLDNLPPSGPGTPVSQRTFGHQQQELGHMGTNSNSSFRMAATDSPAPSRSPVGQGMDSYNQPIGGCDNSSRPTPTLRQYGAYSPDRASPAPSSTYQRSTPAPRPYDAYNPGGRASPAPSAGSYRGAPPGPQYQPMRSATGPVPPRGPYQQPQRNMTAPVPQRGPEGDYFGRPGTPQSMRQAPPQQGYDRAGTPQSMRQAPPQQGYDRAGTPQSMRQAPPQQGYDRAGTPQSQRGAPYGYYIDSQRRPGY